MNRSPFLLLFGVELTYVFKMVLAVSLFETNAPVDRVGGFRLDVNC